MHPMHHHPHRRRGEEEQSLLGLVPLDNDLGPARTDEELHLDDLIRAIDPPGSAESR